MAAFDVHAPPNQTIRNRPSSAEMLTVSNAPRVAVSGGLAVAWKQTLSGQQLGFGPTELHHRNEIGLRFHCFH